MRFTVTHVVTGLRCHNCARGVAAEVSALPGVTRVDVDLASGLLSVTADRPVPTDQLRDAVEEAGYTVAS